MTRRHPRSPLPHTPVPAPTLFRSHPHRLGAQDGVVALAEVLEHAGEPLDGGDAAPRASTARADRGPLVHQRGERHAPAVVDVAQAVVVGDPDLVERSEEHTSELQSIMRNSYAVF